MTVCQLVDSSVVQPSVLSTNFSRVFFLSPQSLLIALGYLFVCLFVCFSGWAVRLAGSYFPNQRLNFGPQQWKSPHHWTTRESLIFESHSGPFMTWIPIKNPLDFCCCCCCLFFNWRIIALQNFVVFCQISTWISHRYTYICTPFWTSLPSPSPSHPSR